MKKALAKLVANGGHERMSRGEIMDWVDAAKIHSYNGEDFKFRDDEDLMENVFSDDGSRTPTQGESAKEWRDFVALSRRLVTQSSTTRRIAFLRSKLLSVALTGSAKLPI